MIAAFRERAAFNKDSPSRDFAIAARAMASLATLPGIQDSFHRARAMFRRFRKTYRGNTTSRT